MNIQEATFDRLKRPIDWFRDFRYHVCAKPEYEEYLCDLAKPFYEQGERPYNAAQQLRQEEPEMVQ